jgi:predicted ATPase
VSDEIGPDGQTTLVGRARELEAIATALATARRGAARVVHLVGEAGIGKTALAEQTAALAAGQGWTVVWGRAWGAEAAPPYWIWQQVLGSLARTTDVATRAYPATVAWLVDLAPELARSADLPPVPALDPSDARTALHRAVVHVLGTAAADRPLLVVLDDVHDADLASLALATLVCRSLPDSPLLVLTTQRPAASGATATTAAALGELDRQGTAVLVGPLNQAAVAAQAALLSGAQPAAKAVGWLYRASGGNPFFVEQLVRWSAAGEGAAVPGQLPVSAAVGRVVGERLAGLGDDARRVVTVAAVAGEEVDQEVLAAVAGLAPGRFADAVAEAVAAGILWHRFFEHPTCGFVHTLLREAARATVEAEVRRGLHLELATVLEALPGRPGRLADVAHHLRAALPAGDPRVMVDQTAAAAEAALRVFAHEAAVAQCTAGLTAIGPYGAGNVARRWQARLLGVLGEAQLQAGDPVRARQTLVEAQALASGAGDPVLAASAAARIPRPDAVPGPRSRAGVAVDGSTGGAGGRRAGAAGAAAGPPGGDRRGR